ncbi:MAG: serine/threonine-protein kinase [Bryobacteraceae bacterium]
MIPRYTSERWKRVCAVSSLLLDATPEQRETILARECAEDSELRADVLAVCGEYSETDELFGVPALSPLRLEDSLIGQRIGPWEILRLLGEGGMGRVFLVERRDGVYTQYAALKLIREHSDPDSVARFHAERRILAMLEHPSIARAIDGGATPEGAPYLVMEYVEGGKPIDEFQPGSPVRDRIRLFLQVVEAVEAAHRNQVAHRDLKPSNILVTPEGRVKVLDFGIAKLVKEDPHPAHGINTLPAALTPSYASPEQLLRESSTLASDIYSLGAVLYKVLTGRPPYDLSDRNLREAMRLVTESVPAAPSSLEKSVDADVDALVLKALERDPVRRYASAAEFAADLRQYLEGSPVKARRGAFWYHASRFAGRHRGVGVAAAVLLAVAAGAGGKAIHDSRLEHERLERVREAAELNISDYESQLSKFTGSTALGNRIASAGKSYLDGVYTDAEKDEQLRRRLAAAYGMLANYQTEKTAAQDSLRKSLSLWREYLKDQAAGTDRLQAAAAARRLGWSQIAQGQLTDADSSLSEGMRLLDSLPASPDDEAVRRERVKLYFEMSRLGAWEGKGAKAIHYARKAVAEHEKLPFEPLDPRGLPVTRMQLADVADTYGSGDPKLLAEALQQTRVAVRSIRDAPACEDWSCREVKASVLTRAPIILMHRGLIQEALELRDGVDLAEALLDEDPGNRSAITSLRFGLHYLGWILNEVGKPEESLRVRRRLLEVSVVLGRNPGSAEARLDEAIACSEVGRALVQLNRLREAKGYFERGAEILEHPPTENVYWFMRQADVHKDLGLLHEKIGRAQAARAEFAKASAAAGLFFAKTGSTLAKQIEAETLYLEGKSRLPVDRAGGCGLLRGSLDRYGDLQKGGQAKPEWETTTRLAAKAMKGCAQPISATLHLP